MSIHSLLVFPLGLALSFPVVAQEYVPSHGRGGDNQLVAASDPAERYALYLPPASRPAAGRRSFS